jgi:hypothetical protein
MSRYVYLPYTVVLLVAYSSKSGLLIHSLLIEIVVYLTSLCVNWVFWHAWAILKRE